MNGCTCRELSSDETQPLGKSVDYKAQILSDLQENLIQPLAEAIQTRNETAADLGALESEREQLQLRARELHNRIRELEQNDRGGPAAARILSETNAKLGELHDGIKATELIISPAQVKADHARHDLDNAARQALRSFSARYQAELMSLLDRAAELVSAWNSAIRETAEQEGIDFGQLTRLNPSRHSLLSTRGRMGF